jgi:hypothetical protein
MINQFYTQGIESGHHYGTRVALGYHDAWCDMTTNYKFFDSVPSLYSTQQSDLWPNQFTAFKLGFKIGYREAINNVCQLSNPWHIA